MATHPEEVRRKVVGGTEDYAVYGDSWVREKQGYSTKHREVPLLL